MVPRLPVDDVVTTGVHPGTEIEGVRVVEPHLGERTGAALQEGMVPLVVERQVGARRHAAGQILQSLEQIGFGFDVRGGGHQLLGFRDRLGQRL